MRFTCKVNISVVKDCELFFPISRDCTNLRIILNGKRFNDIKYFKYGKFENLAIRFKCKTDDEAIIYFDIPSHPSQISIKKDLALSNGDRYCKWKSNGFVESFVKENKGISNSEYVELVAKYIKENLGYKGYGTGTQSDRYDFVDEIVENRLDVDCIGYHSLFVALLRARGIPSILDVGFRLARGDDPHVWAWYYIDKWVNVDLLDDLVPVFGNNDEFPRVSVSIGTTHDFTMIIGKKSVVSYLQYCISDTLLRDNERSAFAVFDSFVKKDFNLELLKKILIGLFSYNDFLYILQQQDYLNIRYAKSLTRFFFRRDIQKRDSLKNTTRIQFIRTVSIFLQIFILYLSYLILYSISLDLVLSLYWLVSLIPVVLFLIPIFILISNSISFPLYSFFKNLNIRKATKKIQSMRNLKIIMISGSYGKTSIKNFIYQLISSQFRTQMTSGNINTHAGIATWILNSLDDNTQYLICEVDGYYKGEIESISKMIPADIVVISYLGDQHLERLGSKKVLARTLLETVTFSKKNSVVITSKETETDLRNNGVKISDEKREVILLDQNNHRNLNNKLSNSNRKNLEFAVAVAKYLDVDNDLLVEGIKNVELPDRRQKVNVLNGFTVIDDSYNISLNTATEGLNRAVEVCQNEKKKLVVIFAGIAELGRENFDSNRKYANMITKNADMVILLNSMFKNEIIEEFNKQNYKSFKVVSNMGEAVKLYQRLYRPSDYVILMHPELTDLYY